MSTLNDNSDYKDIILYEDTDLVFLVTKYLDSPKSLDHGDYVFFIKVRDNICSSAWKFFTSELEAIEYGNNHIKQYLGEGVLQKELARVNPNIPLKERV